MNELQNLRASLLDNVNYDIAKARECYDFITVEEITDRPLLERFPPQSNGVYICYKDGYNELFTGENSKNNIRGIGLVVGNHSLCVSLKEQECITLINTNDNSEFISYISDWNEARLNYFGLSNTKHILSVGTDIVVNEEEYIPSLGESYLMYLYKYIINNALSYVGGCVLKNDWYYSSTENSKTDVWCLNFSNGHQNYYDKSECQFRVRPVSVF